MKNKKQENWVKEQLELNGEISRNECLNNFISRLGAIIFDLKTQGYEFTSGYQINDFGKDYIYKVIKNPEIKILT